MKVQAMLAQKGSRIVTTRPDATISTAIRMLKLEGIGALAVTLDGEHLQGIISERDIVRSLVTYGAELLQMRVAELMTAAVKTCTPEDNIKHVMSEMTRSRIRHLLSFFASRQFMWQDARSHGTGDRRGTCP